MSIPKIIHQIWVGPNKIPEKSINFIEGIKKLHPDYEYRLWTDSDLTPENFSNLQYINSTPVYAQKADIMRYEILYKYGGIYLDIDFEILKCLTPLLTHALVVCNEDSNTSKYITNAFICSSVGNPNMKKCMDNIPSCPLGGKVNVAIATGPWYLRKCITSDDNVRILDTRVMYPTHYTQKGYRPKTFSDETYGMHHWDKNW
jgi:mannosyltransferase OCH1-like enzyme